MSIEKYNFEKTAPVKSYEVSARGRTRVTCRFAKPGARCPAV